MFLKGGWPTEALNTCVIRNIAQLLAWSLNPKAVRALLLGQRLALELARARKRLSLMLADDAVAMERFDDAASAIRADHRVLLDRDLSVESPPRAPDPRWGEVLSLEISEGELSGGLGRQRLAYLYIALGEDAMAEEHVAATLQHTPGDALARVLRAQLALRAVARLASNAAHYADVEPMPLSAEERWQEEQQSEAADSMRAARSAAHSLVYLAWEAVREADEPDPQWAASLLRAARGTLAQVLVDGAYARAQDPVSRAFDGWEGTETAVHPDALRLICAAAEAVLNPRRDASTPWSTPHMLRGAQALALLETLSPARHPIALAEFVARLRALPARDCDALFPVHTPWRGVEMVEQSPFEAMVRQVVLAEGDRAGRALLRERGATALRHRRGQIRDAAIGTATRTFLDSIRRGQLGEAREMLTDLSDDAPTRIDAWLNTRLPGNRWDDVAAYAKTWVTVGDAMSRTDPGALEGALSTLDDDTIAAALRFWRRGWTEELFDVEPPADFLDLPIPDDVQTPLQFRQQIIAAQKRKKESHGTE